MNIQEMECFKLSSNFTKIESSASSHNMYAAVVRTGVHIIEISPNLTPFEKDISSYRSFIKTPKEYPLADLEIDVKKLNREEFCLIHLDYRMFPHFDRGSTAEVYVRQISWLDFQETSISRYAIGVLTNHGCLQFFVKNSFSWKKAHDLSVLWKEYCFKRWFSNEKDGYEGIEKKLKCIHISAFTSCDGYAYQNIDSTTVATISESGVIALWCFPPNINIKSPFVMSTCTTDLSPQSMYWHKLTKKKGWLIVSCHDGLLKLFSVEENNQSVVVQFHYEIWKYPDLISISNLKIKGQENKSLMVFSKENSILVFSLGIEKILTENFYEFEQKVAGVEILNEDHLFVVLINNKTYEVDLEKTDSTSRECVPVAFNSITNLENHKCSGVSFSKNKLWCIFNMKMTAVYDHLIIKEPNYMLLCVLNKKTEIAPKTVESLIKQNVPFIDVHDYVEYLRIRCKKEINFPESNEIKISWDYLNGDIEVCRKFFQMAYILMRCYGLNNSDYFSRNKDKMDAVEIIFMVCNFLFYQEKITAIRKQYFFYKWLDANISKLPSNVLEYQRIKKVSDMMNNFTDVCFEEKCDLCTGNVSDYGNLKYVICEKGHRVLRCSFSFLPISTQTTKECTLCNATVLQNEDTSRCIICDNIF